MYKSFFYLIPVLILTFSACSSKKLTINTLYPSKIDKKFETIEIMKFANDKINQTNYIQMLLANKKIDGKKVFQVKYDNNAQVLLSGEVLEAGVNRTFYYDEEVDYGRCRYYSYSKKHKRRVCTEYKIRRIPCEIRNYKVSTKADLYDTDTQSLLFSNIYTKTYHEDICDRFSVYPYNLNINTRVREINSKLAKEISKEVTNDISPHFRYFDVSIMTNLDDSVVKYSDIQYDSFDKIVDLINDGNIKQAKNLLKKFDGRSVEAMYNLALIYEYEHNLLDANKLYKKAQSMCTNKEDLILINDAINRTNINLVEKIKAKEQLK